MNTKARKVMIIGAGNVGAAVTKLLAPLVLVAFGWHAVAEVWAAAVRTVQLYHPQHTELLGVPGPSGGRADG